MLYIFNKDCVKFKDKKDRNLCHIYFDKSLVLKSEGKIKQKISLEYEFLRPLELENLNLIVVGCV